jgi:hypothetical protein
LHSSTGTLCWNEFSRFVKTGNYSNKNDINVKMSELESGRESEKIYLNFSTQISA